MMIHVAGNLTDTTITPFESNQVQPNGLDLKLDKVFKVDTSAVFELRADNSKTHRPIVEVLPDENGFFNLEEGEYMFKMEGEISIDKHSAGLVVPRSTCMRNALRIYTAAWDSGYNGLLMSGASVKGSVRIERGSCVAQFLLWQAEALNQYNGSYGKNSEHDKKYQ